MSSRTCHSESCWVKRLHGKIAKREAGRWVWWKQCRMLKECRLPKRGCSLMEPTAPAMIWVTFTSSNVGSNPVAGSSWEGGLEVCDSNHSFSNISDIRSSHCANVQRNSTTSRVRSPLWQFCKRSLGPVDWTKERGFVCLLYFNTCGI